MKMAEGPSLVTKVLRCHFYCAGFAQSCEERQLRSPCLFLEDYRELVIHTHKSAKMLSSSAEDSK